MADVLSQVGTGFMGALPDVIYWGGWILLTVVVMGVIAGLYFLMDYKYKVTIMERRGGVGTGFLIGKIKKDRAKLVKAKDGTYSYKLLFNGAKIETIQDKHIIANNNILLMKMSDRLYFPIGVMVKEQELYLEPIDQQTRSWAMNEIKQAAIDYQAKNAFEQYGQYFFMVGTVLFCLVLTGLTVYFTFKYAGGGIDAMNGLSSALNNFGNTIGAPVS